MVRKNEDLPVKPGTVVVRVLNPDTKRSLIAGPFADMAEADAFIESIDRRTEWSGVSCSYVTLTLDKGEIGEVLNS